MRSETFRRICMSFDAWVVAFGLSTLLHDLKLVAGGRPISCSLAVILLDGWLLYRFFSVQEIDRSRHRPTARQTPDGTSGTEAPCTRTEAPGLTCAG